MTYNRLKETDPESSVESQACEYAERRGWMTIKLMQCNIDSMPDRIFHRRGRTLYIEFKKLNKEPTVKQAKRIRDLKYHGIEVHSCDCVEDAMGILK